MKLEILKPSKALNKAYLKQSLHQEQIDVFKSELQKTFDHIDENQDEEYHKNIISKLLLEVYCKDKYLVNVNKKQDLVIRSGNKTDDKVAVILEFKKPTEKKDMVSKEKANVKALQELVLYYLRETIDNNNHGIKYLIATNIYEWFIFDGNWFEKNIYRNTKLRKEYEDYVVAKPGTQHFYDFIAKKYLDEIEDDMPCTYFNLHDFKKIISNPQKEDDNKLIDLYKILSPDHLLKKSFANNANTLNKDFYNELLHIIGLEETKDASKKLIKRKEEKKQDEGSLLENTINILKVRHKLAAIENPQQLGETEDEQLFSVALELCITWLNRILFLKLLEGQLIKYHKANKEFAFLCFDRITDFDEVNELFFEVLAVPSGNRSKSVKTHFKNLPYLNSSLFEESELETKTLVIADLKDRLEIPVSNSTVLKDDSGKKISGNLNSLEYLFRFLGSYNFASDSSAEIQKENKTIINASVLGLIFEKINGYKDGSFFTPSFVTMYMCDDTIRKAVIQKFNSRYGWTCVNFTDLYNQVEKIPKKEASDTINSIRVCDPAVGSGHFLVSALNQIIVIKAELEILIDANEKRLKGYEFQIENDELIITNDTQVFEYNYNDKESQRIQQTLFHEKETIIENCLFGIDINPKSVMICRLRLWIELLKHAYYKAPDYTQLETLPNIDINIKNGNSLIARFDIHDNYSKLPAATQQKIKLATHKYKEQVYLYKSTKEKATKKLAEKNIAELIQTFSKITNPTDVDYKLWNKKEGELLQKQSEIPFGDEKERKQWNEAINRLANEALDLQRKYESKLKTLYSNAFEWRFQFPEVLDDDGKFIGFDIVIGNPPYFSLSKDESNPYYKTTYSTFNTAGDIYCLFYELADDILAENGFLTFITSNKWMRATYGKELREYLLEKTNPYFLFDFGWYQVFENASVDTNILCFQKTDYTSNLKAGSAQKDFDLEFLAQYATQNLTTLQVSGSDYWNVAPEENQNLKTKIETIGKKLEEWNFQVNYGIKSGFNDGFQIDTETRTKLIEKDKKNAEILVPLLRGRDIERYGYNFNDIYLINTYNGFIVTIKDPDKNIQEQPDKTYLYKPENNKKWFTAKRIERGKGNQYRIDRIIVEVDYPSVHEYMLQFEDGLKKREDQGNHWTNLRNCAYDEQFKTEKLVWAETMRVHKTGNRNFPRFGYDNTKCYMDKTAFIGVGDHLKYLLAVFNSAVGKWLIMEYVGKLDTGGYMMQKIFLDKIPIVEPDEPTEREIKILVDEILKLKQTNPEANTSTQEKSLDKLIYKIFNLTPEEQKIIEST